MLIAGFQKLTLVDYPDKLAALIFTQGCNFACSYCHNSEMVPRLRVLPYDPHLEPKNILTFLSRRKGILDGVVISGGEPTLHDDLDDFIRQIREMGFLIKLDSNGSRPEVLQKLLDQKLLDYIAMDIKYTPGEYEKKVRSVPFKNIQESVNTIMKSGIDYEFRSTLVPSLHNLKDIQQMGSIIKGARHWNLQNFRSLKTLDKKLADQRSFSSPEMKRFQRAAQKYAQKVEVR